MSDEVNPCACPERLVDMACYGIHACKDGKRIAPEDLYVEPTDEVKLLPCPLRDALTDARNNILSLLGAFRDDMPPVAVKLFQAQAKQIDEALATRPTDMEVRDAE